MLNKAGTAFITVTEDNGKVKSVSGRDVTITEAIGSVTYKDVTVTLPADAKIIRNGKTATVDDLKAGDRIHVSQSSDGTFVFAADASFRPGPGKGRGHRHGPGRGSAPAARRPAARRPADPLIDRRETQSPAAALRGGRSSSREAPGVLPPPPTRRADPAVNEAPRSGATPTSRGAPTR